MSLVRVESDKATRCAKLYNKRLLSRIASRCRFNVGRRRRGSKVLNGWKAIAGYLKRDERTAMRWAAERDMPIHRVPGTGRGSIYALEGELDAWLEADRTRYEHGRSVPVVIGLIDPPSVRTSPITWWRRRWIATALIASGALLVGAGAMTLHLSQTEVSVPVPAFSDPTTKAIFLQASYDWNLRTRDSLTRAVREYGDTITRDPRVPAAYVGLANSYLLLREYGSLPDADAYPRAEAAAKAAVALSPGCAEAHRALAFITFWWRRDRVTARREFGRALALKPDDPLTHHWLSNALLVNGEPKAALREIDRARDIDPVSTSIISDRALTIYYTGHRAEGLAALRALARDQPENVSTHHTLAEIALYEGRPDEFLREFATTARLRADAAGLAKAKRWRSAGRNVRGIAAMMLHEARQSRAGWFQIARSAAMAGRHDEAAEALARACRAGEPDTIVAPVDLWLSRALSPGEITDRCGRPLPLS